jgi:sucrose synthase
MQASLEEYLQDNRDACYALLRRYIALGKPFLLRSEIVDECRRFCEENPDFHLEDTPLYQFVLSIQDATVDSPWIHFASRPSIARWTYYRVHAESLSGTPIGVSEYLAVKERLVNGASNSISSHFSAGSRACGNPAPSVVAWSFSIVASPASFFRT